MFLAIFMPFDGFIGYGLYCIQYKLMLIFCYLECKLEIKKLQNFEK